MKKIEIKTFEQDRIGELVNRLAEQEKSTKGEKQQAMAERERLERTIYSFG